MRLEDEINWLRDELHVARDAVMVLLPEWALSGVASDPYARHSWLFVDTDKESHEKLQAITDAVRTRAYEQASDPQSAWGQRRVPCPLCKETPDSHDGFTLPEGLDRHLRGWGNQRQCDVLRTIDRALHEWVRFHERQAKEDAESDG